MDAYLFLMQYSNAMAQLKDLKDELSKLELSIGGGGINYDGMPKGTSISKPTERDAIGLALKQKKVSDKEKEAEQIKQDIEKLINRIKQNKSTKYRNKTYLDHRAVNMSIILKKRYLNLNACGQQMEWKAISEEMGYSESHAKFLHQSALKLAEEILNNEKKDNTK